MLTYSSVKAASRVLSVRDIDYPLESDIAFHSFMKIAAIRRITRRLHKPYTELVQYALEQPAASRVWATVFEYNNEPALVIRNLAFTRVRQAYRRVLRVRMDGLVPAPETESEDVEIVEQPCPSVFYFAVIGILTLFTCIVMLMILYTLHQSQNPRYLMPIR